MSSVDIQETSTALQRVLDFIQAFQHTYKKQDGSSEFCAVVFSGEHLIHLSIDDLVDVASQAAFAAKGARNVDIPLVIQENRELRNRLVKLRNAFKEELSKPL